MQTVRPASVDELATALRETTGSVCVRGQGHASYDEGADLCIDMTGLNQVVEHSAADLVVTAQAGMALEALQHHLQPHRQWLALDPFTAGTIGGLLSRADSGPRRLRFGPPRDLLLGVTVVLADGTVARSGGKVVKNVAGYDLGKLFTGAWGTLGVIAQATFRLHPSVIARRVVSTPTDDPWPLVQAVLHTTAAPTAIEWYDDTLHVLVESSEAAVDPQTQRVAAAISGQVADQLPVGWEELHRPDGGMLVKLTYQLSGLASLPTAVRAVLPGARLRAHAGSGVMYVAAAADASAVDELRRIVGSLDGAAVVVAAAPEFLARVDRWGPVRGLDVMRRIKAEFDPERRMNPGRFVGDI